MRHSALYTILFAACVCLVCSILVCTAAVTLAGRQEENALLYKHKNVLLAAGLIEPRQTVSLEEVEQQFEVMHPCVVDLATGAVLAEVDAEAFNPEAEPHVAAPENNAQIHTVPTRALVYELVRDGKTEMLILPVYGKGLWSTIKGFLALDAADFTIQGITFYEHAETPGLGGEIDNPAWQALWKDREAFYDDMNPIIEVVKGQASNDHEVDGLSGATLTSRGVSNLVRYWLGGNGFGPFLKEFKKGGTS